MQRLSLFIFALSLLGSTLSGCAVYPEGSVVIVPAGHHHDQDHEDEDEDDNEHHHRQHEGGHDHDHEDN